MAGQRNASGCSKAVVQETSARLAVIGWQAMGRKRRTALLKLDLVRVQQLEDELRAFTHLVRAASL